MVVVKNYLQMVIDISVSIKMVNQKEMVNIILRLVHIFMVNLKMDYVVVMVSIDVPIIHIKDII